MSEFYISGRETFPSSSTPAPLTESTKPHFSHLFVPRHARDSSDPSRPITMIRRESKARWETYTLAGYTVEFVKLLNKAQREQSSTDYDHICTLVEGPHLEHFQGHHFDVAEGCATPPMSKSMIPHVKDMIEVLEAFQSVDRVNGAFAGLAGALFPKAEQYFCTSDSPDEPSFTDTPSKQEIPIDGGKRDLELAWDALAGKGNPANTARWTETGSTEFRNRVSEILKTCKSFLAELSQMFDTERPARAKTTLFG